MEPAKPFPKSWLFGIIPPRVCTQNRRWRELELEGRAMQMSWRRSRTLEESGSRGGRQTSPEPHDSKKIVGQRSCMKLPQTAILREIKKFVPAGLAMVLSQPKEEGVKA